MYPGKCTRGFGGLHSPNHILQGARLGVQAGVRGWGWRSPTPGCSRGTGTGVTQRSQAGCLGADSHRCSWRKRLVPTGSKLCSFSQTSGFPQSPGRQLQRPSPRFPALSCAGAGLCCCSLHSCRDAGAGGKPVPPLPWDLSTGKTHSPIPAGIFLCGGQQGDGEGPWHCLSHPASSGGCSDPEGMYNPFAFNHVQAMRFLPCRRAFGLLQPLA